MVCRVTTRTGGKLLRALESGVPVAGGLPTPKLRLNLGGCDTAVMPPQFGRREIPVQSWNYIGHDPKEFRHYGPVAQDFFAAFGHDDIGTIGSPTTINSGDMQGILMIAVQALEKLAAEQREDIKRLKADLEQVLTAQQSLAAVAH